MNLIAKIKSWHEGLLALKEKQAEEELASRFSVAEKDGKIFVRCNGTAIAVCEDVCSAEGIAGMLAQCRRAALLYAKGEDKKKTNN